MILLKDPDSVYAFWVSPHVSTLLGNESARLTVYTLDDDVLWRELQAVFVDEVFEEVLGIMSIQDEEAMMGSL